MKPKPNKELSFEIRAAFFGGVSIETLIRWTGMTRLAIEAVIRDGLR